MYKRHGISVFASQDNKYDLLGARTVFRLVCTGVVEKLVKEGKWFSFCTKISEEQMDVMTYVNDKGIKLNTLISGYFENSSYRSNIYKYLLRDFLCYYEAPTVVKDTWTGYGYKSSYNKYLVTSNIYVVALWMGISLDEAADSYGKYLLEVNADMEDDYGYPYLKLYVNKQGKHCITKPRKYLDLSAKGTRIVPLFALKRGVDTLYSMCSEDTYDVSFFKDGGQIRTINTTFNVDLIKGVYGDCDFFRTGIAGMYSGEFLDNSSLERGYIRVFEMGGSRYDNPLRSINYARITKFEKASPDLSYINIDIENVLSSFVDGINAASINVGDFVSMLNIFKVGSERRLNGHSLKTVQDIELWANRQHMLLSTVFSRQLALFMLGNPQWFPNYTGEPEYLKKSDDSGNTGSTGMGIPDFDDLDFSM